MSWTISTSGPWGRILLLPGTPANALQRFLEASMLPESIDIEFFLTPSSPSYAKHEFEFQQNKAVHMAKMSRKLDPVFDTSDSSSSEEVTEASAAPEPDAGYTYSFDAARGPSKGSQILGMALARAVDKFETKATEKLVKEEYEVVAKENDEAHTGYAADEDDFELI